MLWAATRKQPQVSKTETKEPEKHVRCDQPKQRLLAVRVLQPWPRKERCSDSRSEQAHERADPEDGAWVHRLSPATDAAGVPCLRLDQFDQIPHPVHLEA